MTSPRCEQQQSINPEARYPMRLGERGKHLLKLCRYSVDIRGLRMYYRLEVELAYLVDFVQFLLWFALHFTFLHSEL